MKLIRIIPIEQIKENQALTLEQFGFTLVKTGDTIKVYVEVVK